MSDTILSNHLFYAYERVRIHIRAPHWNAMIQRSGKERKKRVHNDDEDATTKDDVAANAMTIATQDNVHTHTT